MMLSNLELYILLALPAAVAWLSVSLYRQYKRLSHIPGPRSAGFSKWWFVKATLSGRTHLDLYQVCEKYGTFALGRVDCSSSSVLHGSFARASSRRGNGHVSELDMEANEGPGGRWGPGMKAKSKRKESKMAYWKMGTEKAWDNTKRRNNKT